MAGDIGSVGGGAPVQGLHQPSRPETQPTTSLNEWIQGKIAGYEKKVLQDGIKFSFSQKFNKYATFTAAAKSIENRVLYKLVLEEIKNDPELHAKFMDIQAEEFNKTKVNETKVNETKEEPSNKSRSVFKSGLGYLKKYFDKRSEVVIEKSNLANISDILKDQFNGKKENEILSIKGDIEKSLKEAAATKYNSNYDCELERETAGVVLGIMFFPISVPFALSCIAVEKISTGIDDLLDHVGLAVTEKYEKL